MPAGALVEAPVASESSCALRLWWPCSCGCPQGSCRCCVRTFGLQQTKVSADFCDRRVKQGQQTRVSQVTPRRNRYFLRGSRGLGPRHQCRWCSSVSRLCARNIRGFDCSFLLASRPQGPGRCAAAAAFGPAQRRTYPTSGLNCTVPLSEPAPACDPVRGHNFAGYTGSSSKQLESAPSPERSSVVHSAPWC